MHQDLSPLCIDHQFRGAYKLHMWHPGWIILPMGTYTPRFESILSHPPEHGVNRVLKNFLKLLPCANFWSLE